jgi:hypothetical protein
MSRGIPSWTELVVDLIANNTEQFSDLWPNYRRAVASWIADSRDFTPVTLTGAVKRKFESKKGWTERNQLAYLKAVQSALYRPLRLAQATVSAAPPNSPPVDTLGAVAKLIKRSEDDARHIPAVVTTNFDSLLEDELRTGVKLQIVHDGHNLAVGKELMIFHVHGYIPRPPAAVTLQSIVFAEDEYHELTYQMFHWALVELVHFLRGATVLFVGFSMTDPNIRRLLEATRNGENVRHVAILPESIADTSPMGIEAEIQKRAASIDPSFVKTAHQLARDIGDAVDEAKRYRDAVLERLGVHVWRAPTVTDIPTMLTAIGG